MGLFDKVQKSLEDIGKEGKMMNFNLSRSHIMKKGKVGETSTVLLPSGPVEILINPSGKIVLEDRKCTFTKEKTPTVQHLMGWKPIHVCGDILITILDMKYDLSSKNGWERAFKEKTLILEHYSRLEQDNPQIFVYDDSKLTFDDDFKLPRLEKEKSKSYLKLNIDLEWLKNEIVGYHSMKNHPESSILRKKDLIYIQIGGGRWAYGTIIDGTPNDFKVSTGPLKVVKAKSAAFVVPTALLTGGIGIAAKSTGAIIDKKKTDAFMKYIDERIYQNKGNGPELVQNISTESKSEDDIPEKIKKLSDLKDQGILTDEEFEAKKKDLLDKM